MIDRREFLAAGIAGGAAFASGLHDCGATVPGARRFHLNYAPHFGTFRHLAGDDPLDQLRFMADAGFRAVEDVGLRHRSPVWQQRVGGEAARRGMVWGEFLATSDCGRPTFASGIAALREDVLRDVEDALQVAARTNATWMTVVPGKTDPRQSPSRQMDHAVELLGQCASLCEMEGRVLLLEPLNHGDMFLRTLSQGDELCRAVGSPSCKLLVDVSQHAGSTAALIRKIDRCWDQIAYFQVGDNPGRKEPGSGGIDFCRLFRYLASQGYGGILGMDHGNSQPGEAGEARVIEAYAALECIP